MHAGNVERLLEFPATITQSMNPRKDCAVQFRVLKHFRCARFSLDLEFILKYFLRFCSLLWRGWHCHGGCRLPNGSSDDNFVK